MNLYAEARKANEDAMKERFPDSVLAQCNHGGLDWEVFLNEGEYGFLYLGRLESPDMFNYETGREFNPKFKEWFLERMKAYITFRGWSDYSLQEMCYREHTPFGEIPADHQMTYPFRGD